MSRPAASSRLKRKHILICHSRTIDYPEDQAITGIRRFAVTRPDWRLGHLNTGFLDETILNDVLAWKPDGVIVVTPLSRIPDIAAWNAKLPMVLVDLRHQRPEGFSRIEIDSVQAGKKAAAYFLQNGFQHFAVALWPRNPPFSRLQAQGYCEALHAEQHIPARFEIRENAGHPWHRNPDLDAWLLDLPKPAGLFCVSDATALRILEHCDRLNIGVPSELSILSSGNHTTLCETTRPALSSIHMCSDLLGFRAATVLDERLRTQPRKPNPDPVCESLEPGEVVERQSSSLRAIDDPAIAKAADFLLEHVAQGITIDDAAREAGLTRRSMERGFKRHLDVTPGEYLRRLKLDYAKRLLTETDLRMNEIADACGMVPEHFSAMFRKETGRTPGTYRKEKIRGVTLT